MYTLRNLPFMVLNKLDEKPFVCCGGHIGCLQALEGYNITQYGKRVLCGKNRIGSPTQRRKTFPSWWDPILFLTFNTWLLHITVCSHLNSSPKSAPIVWILLRNSHGFYTTIKLRQNLHCIGADFATDFGMDFKPECGQMGEILTGYVCLYCARTNAL